MTIIYLILFLCSASLLEIIFCIIYRKGKKNNYYDLLYNFKFRQDIFNIIRTDIKIIIAIVFIFILLGCGTKKEYIRVPMSTPPAKYFILDYNSKNTFELEHINALKKISEWQSWYNIQVKSNYFNYSSNEIYQYYNYSNNNTNASLKYK